MLTNAILQLEIYVFAKDRQGKFLFCNDRFAEAAGLDSCHQIVGKDDYDLVWRHQAHVFRSGDQKVLQGKPFINVQEVMLQSQKEADILVNKHQLLNKADECIGLIGSFIDITGHRLQKKTGHYDSNTGRFCLGEAFANEHLSAQQYQVFRYILLGLSAPQIAKRLKLSRRTVEAYIATIKHKLQCRSKGEIIALAISAGLMHVVDDDGSTEIV